MPHISQTVVSVNFEKTSFSIGNVTKVTLWAWGGLRKPRQFVEVQSVTYRKNQRDQSFPMIPRSSRRS